jgi:hypothetical protein
VDGHRSPPQTSNEPEGLESCDVSLHDRDCKGERFADLVPTGRGDHPGTRSAKLDVPAQIPKKKVEPSPNRPRWNRHFGTGNHLAGLNFGDCVACALEGATCRFCSRAMIFVGTDVRSSL